MGLITFFRLVCYKHAAPTELRRGARSATLNRSSRRSRHIGMIFRDRIMSRLTSAATLFIGRRVGANGVNVPARSLGFYARKRQRTGAVQNAGAPSGPVFL